MKHRLDIKDDLNSILKCLSQVQLIQIKHLQILLGFTFEQNFFP